jgi:hypothetical protein
MSKLMPLSDFRARRRVLTRRDFGYAPKPAPRPSDIIDHATWDSIVTLPDDVAVRTTNYHGTTVKQLHELWGAWIECVGEKQDSMFPVMLDAGDDFQAATYNALTGFYRLSAAALRSALELTTIGAWAQITGRKAEFNNWRSGKSSLSLRDACDGLIGATVPLKTHLRTVVGGSLFDQKKDSTDEGGFARRIFSGLSEFSHSRPGYSDSDMRESNGPIYVKGAFNHVAWMQFEALGLCFVLLLIARPKQRLPEAVIELFGDVKRMKSRVTRAAFEFLYGGVTESE